MNAHARIDAAPDAAGMSPLLTSVFAAACGTIVANLYYGQPLIAPISADLGIPVHIAGLIVTMTQIGYGVGLLFIVPLGDLVENRKLVLSVVGLAALALLGAAAATSEAAFLSWALLIGLGSVAVQILVPFASHLAPDATRGRVVGNVMTGLTTGILLARPVSSFITSLSSWRVVYVLSAAIMVTLALVLHYALPRRVPVSRIGYGALLASMAHLLRTTPVLRRRALYQCGLFAAFSLFWTTAPLLLLGPDFQFSQRGVALFALAGAAGAIAAPVAGRVADRGWSRPATGITLAVAACAFLLTQLWPPGSAMSLAALVTAGIAIDFSVQANVVLGYRAIFMLGSEYRSRLNGLYMASFFTAGALGSAAGAWTFAQGGWTPTAWVGMMLPIASLLYFATES